MTPKVKKTGRQTLWFIALYLGGVAAVLIVSYTLRALVV